jgi:hypothetical protein
MKDAGRSSLIEAIRAEIVGPGRIPPDVQLAHFGSDQQFIDANSERKGALAWRPDPEAALEEVIFYERENPQRKYGAGQLHPSAVSATPPDMAAAIEGDTLGADDESAQDDIPASEEQREEATPAVESDGGDDLDIAGDDIRQPSTLALSLCVALGSEGRLIVKLPRARRFFWQQVSDAEFPLNGRYEPCTRVWTDRHGVRRTGAMSRRVPAVLPDSEIVIQRSELQGGKPVRKDVPMPERAPLSLRVEVFPRVVKGRTDCWLVTVVLRNTSRTEERDPKQAVLYQTYFEVRVADGTFEPYPESQRPFKKLDAEEQSLALLYRESATWAIGHGCAAAWDAESGTRPDLVYADILPAVELPSMTPDIRDSEDRPIHLGMRDLAFLNEDGKGAAWEAMEALAREYERWIESEKKAAKKLDERFRETSERHLGKCEEALKRIRAGILHLRGNSRALRAFRLANLAMLLQQISAKTLRRRPLEWHAASTRVRPAGEHVSPWKVFSDKSEGPAAGIWRAFQAAFLLMSISGLVDETSADREIVDLIWFPTGGGKTEAYLGVLAFYLFHQRLLIQEGAIPGREGTGALMRYTLRMLTTQQFQRAASLICAMEFLRRNPSAHSLGVIPGRRFSLGLWIGGDGSPNKIADAKAELAAYRRGDVVGNPLVLTECPWCRAEIGRFSGSKPNVSPRISEANWSGMRTKGIGDGGAEGPLLLCPDAKCEFGAETISKWLPVEVIDERIYKYPPSLVIATADKLAMTAYRPLAGSLFGREVGGGAATQVSVPPGLIIQDELHLISGPLGTMYAFYEAVFERLCSHRSGEELIKPKIISSTATIRGAEEQVLSVYGRARINLFPSPALSMGDSFFGTYARDEDKKLSRGRLYLGIHANSYGSILTTQVRSFSAALFKPFTLDIQWRDPWWTLLVFYNSIRELGGAKTLFDSDIRSRLKYMFNREGFGPQDRRNLAVVEELTSRLSQAEIVTMMDRLSAMYDPTRKFNAIDACLASSIIEVGVDIDRLSLMGIVGQPKTTSQYIQVTGRVGRRWWERPGLILTLYNPNKSRDRSHFEQFHSYHRRLYERVEPTSATPFAPPAIQRALPGALIAWARQHSDAEVNNYRAFAPFLQSGLDLLKERCERIQSPEDLNRSLADLQRNFDELVRKWGLNPQMWEEFPQSPAGEYLMLWPGQFATVLQKDRATIVASSLRQVDRSAELEISDAYALQAQRTQN